MLKRKNCGGHEYGNLLAAHYCLERRAQCNLGLAEANVTAKQAVHRHGLHHIALDLLDCDELRLGLLIFKGSGKLVLKLTVGGECKAGAPLPFGVKTDKVLCDILCRALCTRLCATPVTAAHLGKLDRAALVLFADIFSDQLKAVTGHEELIRACIFYGYIILGNTVDSHRFDALEKSDTVVCVNDVIADGEVGIAHQPLTCATDSFKNALLSALLHKHAAVGPCH